MRTWKAFQDLDELAEIHTFISDIVQYRLVAVALVLHVAHLHLQAQVFGYLATLDHGGVFAALGLPSTYQDPPAWQCGRCADVILRLEVGFLDLQFHESSGEC